MTCNCVPGSYLCPEAEDLWRETGRKYQMYQAGKATWENYETAVQAYKDHVDPLLMQAQTPKQCPLCQLNISHMIHMKGE